MQNWEDQIWNEMKRVRSRMNQALGMKDFSNQSLECEPRNYRQAWADLKENEKEFQIAVEIPGVSKEDISLEILDNGRLVIKAEKNQNKDSKNLLDDANSCCSTEEEICCSTNDSIDDSTNDSTEQSDDCCTKDDCNCQPGKAHRYSRLKSYSGFYKTIRLPESADLKNISANHKDGILKISIPKIPTEKRKRSININ
jgi:HSP20 family molecular chaperone IbpA